MFTGRPTPPLPSLVTDAGWATGFLHLCAQSALTFGAARATPVRSRPIVEIRREGARIVVLPCTSQDKTQRDDFFELTPARVMWVQANARRGFCYYRYETVQATALVKEKVGTMDHGTRLDLLQWLKGRY